MTSVYLWGDSWAKTHPEQILISKGYVVNNLATNGAGNFHSLYLSEKYDAPDYVIWYHTEMLRDLELMTNRFDLFGCPYTFRQALHDIANRIYEIASLQLGKWKNTKLVLLQAQSPIIEPEFSKWIDPYLIKNWRKDLYSQAGKNLGECTHLSTHDKISSSQCHDTQEEKNAMLHLVDRHYEEMCGNELFPDNGHPSALAHQQLIDWFIKMDQGTL